MSQPILTDVELDYTIGLARKGDVVAFNRLVERFQRDLFTVALRIVGDSDEAADMTQEAIIAAFHGLPRFKGGNFRVWLLRIVTNQCLDYLRARKRHTHVSLDAITEAGEEWNTPLAVEGNPMVLFEQQELRELLQQALLALPTEQRVAIILSDIEGLHYDEIAQVTQTQLGTVKSRIARGRLRLQQYLLQQQELLPRKYRHITQNDPSHHQTESAIPADRDDA